MFASHQEEFPQPPPFFLPHTLVFLFSCQLAPVDSLFRFSSDLVGDDYSGCWIDASSFELTVADTGGAPRKLDRDARDPLLVLDGFVKQTSPACAAASNGRARTSRHGCSPSAGLLVRLARRLRLLLFRWRLAA